MEIEIGIQGRGENVTVHSPAQPRTRLLSGISMHSHYDHLIELRHAGKYAELRVAECSVGQVSLLPPLDWREMACWCCLLVLVVGAFLFCALSLCRFYTDSHVFFSASALLWL